MSSTSRILSIFSRNNNNSNSLRSALGGYNAEVKSRAAINFKVFKAKGGYVLEFYAYDEVNDKSETRLYVIQDTDKLAEEIAMICSQEFLQL